MDLQGHPRPIELQAIKSDGLPGKETGEKISWSLRYREGARYSDSARGMRWNGPWVTLFSGLQSIAFAFEAPIYPAPQALRRGVMP